MLKDFSNVIGSNETYLDLDKKINDLLNNIKKHIPKEKLFLLEKLETLYNIQEGVTEELLYKQGIIDGARLNKQ